MTSAPDPALATTLVVWGGLLLGLALGAVAQATRFCVRGSISDYVIFRGPARLFAWLLAAAVAMVLLQLMISLGVFDASRTLGWSNRLAWLSTLVGGFVFGIGMMLAPGCPQRCLVKAGAGDLKALVTLMVVGLAALMTLRGAFAVPRASWLDSASVALAGPQDLGSLLGGGLLSPGGWRLLLAAAALAGVAVFAWRARGRLDRSAWVGGIGVGLLVAVAFLLTGRIGFLAEHPETLEPAWVGTQARRPEGLSFVAPVANAIDLLTLWTDKNTVLTFGITLALGVLLGSHLSARVRGEYRVESFRTREDLTQSLLGGTLMGFGGVTALGCSVGNGVTGVALLSTGAFLAVAGMVAGALVALRLHAGRAAPAAPGSAGPTPA
ncbi:MAG TPA: YeeE/YedE family protein [Ramlibacter sp.]|nr:YeeE/YedE family protein [Ramlibacter sp.]